MSSNSMDKGDMDIDWYAMLGIAEDASSTIIQKAVRKLGLRYHPDKTSDPADHAMFIQIQKAKDFLTDDKKRKEYDDNRNRIKARKDHDEQRDKTMDNRRKRFRDELEAKLQSTKQSNTSTTATSTSASSSSRHDDKRFKGDKYQKEIDRLQTEGNDNNDNNDNMTIS
jgi:DnaJ-class molecular chaperone